MKWRGIRSEQIQASKTTFVLLQNVSKSARTMNLHLWQQVMDHSKPSSGNSEVGCSNFPIPSETSDAQNEFER
jgi:hypothetical protein